MHEIAKRTAVGALLLLIMPIALGIWLALVPRQ